jgi:hypothetical protein
MVLYLLLNEFKNELLIIYEIEESILHLISYTHISKKTNAK